MAHNAGDESCWLLSFVTVSGDVRRRQNARNMKCALLPAISAHGKRFGALLPRAVLLGVVGPASVLQSGCAVGPQFHRPEAPRDAGFALAPLPETTSSTKVHGGETQHLVSGADVSFEWWRAFGSPALDALVERAFKANPTIPAAQAALRQAHELVSAQRGFFFPTFDAVYQGERHKVSGNTENSETPGVQASGTNLLPQRGADGNPVPAPVYYTFHTAELTVGFVPDVFGGNRRQVESLAAQAEAQRFTFEATYITLASDIVAAVIQEASLRAEIEATRQIVAADGQSLRILREQFRLGYVTRIDVATQEAALAAVETTLPPLQQRLEQTRDLIRALAGSLPNEELGSFELDTLTLPAQLPVSLPAKIIEQRPDVRAAEAQLHAANAQVGVAVAAMLPQFSISGVYGGNATQISQMFSAGGPFWSLFANATQPLFHGGTLLHQRRAADRALRQAGAQYRTTVISAYQNVADALHASLSDADELSADVDAEDAAKVTFDLTRRQMEAGYTSSLPLLSAQSAYQQAVLTRVQAQAVRFGDTVALFQALGGGWWNRTERLSWR
jgi:NodT family efflux transporter outer membrane factor (OMF) lipoprotein